MNRVLIPLVALFSAALPLLIDSALKGAALLALAWVVALALWKASAATRHLVWLFAVAALLVLPVLSALLPGWRALPSWTAVTLPAMPSPTTEAQPPMPVLRPAAVAPAPTVVPVIRNSSAPTTLPERTLTIRDWLPLVWAAGFALLVVRVFAAYWFLRRVTKRCTKVTDERLAQMLETSRRQLDIRQPVPMLMDSRRTIPMVWGLFRPCLLLPAEALEWGDSQVRSVILHELAHIKRRDLAVQWLMQFACALHWFNPLVWFAAWRLHVEGERACDNLVLAGGVRASEYAEHLLHVATKLDPAHRTPACGLAMARPSRLEGRLLAVLNGRLNRQGVTRALALATLALGLGVTIPVAMLRAADGKKPEARKANLAVTEQKSATSEYSSHPELPWTATGRVTDPEGKPLADVEIWVHAGMGTLKRTGTAKTATDGRYTVSFGRGWSGPIDMPNLQVAQVTAHKIGFFEKNLSRQGGRAAALREVPPIDLIGYGVTAEELFLPDKPQTIDFVMMPAARIKGRLLGTGKFPNVTPQEATRRKDPKPVTDHTQLQLSPLAGWRVWLIGEELPPGTSVFASATTAPDGEFVFEDVPTGYEWQFQTDTHRQGRNAEPKSAAFELERAGEASFELEVPEDQQVVHLLQAPGRRAQSFPAFRQEAAAVVDVGDDGTLLLSGQAMTPDALMRELVARRRTNPDMPVTIQASSTGEYKNVAKLLDELNKVGIKPVSIKAQNGDVLQASRIRLEQAEQELKRAFELRQQNVVTGSAYDEAVTKVEMLRAELDGNKTGAASVKLRQAKANLERVTELHKTKVVSDHELEQARLAVKLSEAELKGDLIELSRIRLEHSEQELKRVSELHRQHVVSDEEYEKAASTVAILRAELAGDKAEVGRLKLRHAEDELKRVTELHNARLVSEHELNRAKRGVRLAEAELKGDAMEVSRIRLKYAEDEMMRATELRRRNLISKEGYQKAMVAAANLDIQMPTGTTELDVLKPAPDGSLAIQAPTGTREPLAISRAPEAPKAGKPKMEKPKDSANNAKPAANGYAKSGVPFVDLDAPMTWSAEQNGLCLGIHFPKDADWRIGKEVKVELWIKNSGEKDAKFEFPERNDFGLRVLMTGKDGKEHAAGFTILWLRHQFKKLLLPPGHAVKVREFSVVLAPSGANQQGQNKTFALAPGEYKFHCEHDLMWTVINGADGKPLKPAADVKTGILKSGEVDVKLVGADAP